MSARDIPTHAMRWEVGDGSQRGPAADESIKHLEGRWARAVAGGDMLWPQQAPWSCTGDKTQAWPGGGWPLWPLCPRRESCSPWPKAAQGRRAVLAESERTHRAKHVPEGGPGRCGFQASPHTPLPPQCTRLPLPRGTGCVSERACSDLEISSHAWPGTNMLFNQSSSRPSQGPRGARHPRSPARLYWNAGRGLREALRGPRHPFLHVRRGEPLLWP